MDEELEQPKNKITLSSFFESIASVERVANNALSIANSNLNIIQEQRSLIDALSLSIEGLRGDIQEVNNYITIQKDEVSDKLVENRDDKQKQMISERLQGLQGEKGEKGEKGEGSVSESQQKKQQKEEEEQLEEFVNKIIDEREQKKENERKDELKEKEDAEQKKELSEKLGVKDFAKGIAQSFGGEKIEKKAGTTEGTTEEGGGIMDFLKNPLVIGAGLFGAGFGIPNIFPKTVNKQERKTIESIDKIGKESTVDELQKIVDKPSIMDRISGRHAEAKEQLYFIKEGKTKGYGYDFEQNPRTYDFDKEKNVKENLKSGDVSSATIKEGKVVSGDMSQSDAQRNSKLLDLESQLMDAETSYGFNSPESNKIQKEIMMLKGTPEKSIYTDKTGNLNVKGYSTFDGETTDKKGKGLFGGLFSGDKKNKNIKSDDKKGRGLFDAMGGTIDAATGNLTDFDKRGGKPFGLMRGITGTIDTATGGLTDLDRRGGKPFGLMRGITGSIDAMSGGLTDLDRRGGKPFGLMRGITGSIDAMTGNKFDLDRRGDGKKLYDEYGRYIGDNERKLNMQNKKNELYGLKSKIPMETTVSPDGTITSVGSGELQGGEIIKPGEPLTEKQRSTITMGLSMGNTYSSEIMKSYNESMKPIIESKQKNLSQETLASPDTSTPQIITMPGQNQGSNNVIAPSIPKMREGELQSTSSSSSFVHTISNNVITSSRKSNSGLPPEIARMIN